MIHSVELRAVKVVPSKHGGESVIADLYYIFEKVAKLAVEDQRGFVIRNDCFPATVMGCLLVQLLLTPINCEAISSAGSPSAALASIREGY